MTFRSKKLLLVDGVGALISAVLLGVVLVHYQHSIGLPTHVLHFLAALAGVFACFSFGSYCASKANWRLLLKCMAWANLVYCSLTLGLLCYYKAEITPLGTLYFVGEVAVIAALAYIELKVATQD